MRCLLDTHAFLWIIDGDRRLSAAARDAFLDPENTLFLSAASYWEIGLKISLGKLELGGAWPRIIEEEMRRNAIGWLPLERDHMEGVVSLPWHHRDPFDRMLISQARHEDLAILTIDQNIGKYEVRTIW